VSTQGDDYARRFAEWQRAEAAARQAEVKKPPPPERDYKYWEVLTREHENAERSAWYRRRILGSITSLSPAHTRLQKEDLRWRRTARGGTGYTCGLRRACPHNALQNPHGYTARMANQPQVILKSKTS
jgi:hypothetical protein